MTRDLLKRGQYLRSINRTRFQFMILAIHHAIKNKLDHFNNDLINKEEYYKIILNKTNLDKLSDLHGLGWLSISPVSSWLEAVLKDFNDNNVTLDKILNFVEQTIPAKELEFATFLSNSFFKHQPSVCHLECGHDNTGTYSELMSALAYGKKFIKILPQRNNYKIDMPPVDFFNIEQPDQTKMKIAEDKDVPLINIYGELFIAERKQHRISIVEKGPINPTVKKPIINKQVKLIIGFPYEQYFRLFIDGYKQVKGASSFEEKEPGYLQGMYSAFLKYILPNIHESVTIDTLKSIHKEATSNIIKPNNGRSDSQDFKPGVFRRFNEQVNFTLTLGGNTSKEGLIEIREQSLIYDFIVVNNKEKIKLQGTKDTTRIPDLVTNVLTDYENTIKNCDSKKEKLTAIAEMISKLERIHPFNDGNCRSICMLLLQKELARANLDPAIMYDPNMFDGFSEKEMIEEIEEGQERYKQLRMCKPLTFKSKMSCKGEAIEPALLPIDYKFGLSTYISLIIRNPNLIPERISSSHSTYLKIHELLKSMHGEAYLANKENTLSEIVNKISAKGYTLWEELTRNERYMDSFFTLIYDSGLSPPDYNKTNEIDKKSICDRLLESKYGAELLYKRYQDILLALPTDIYSRVDKIYKSTVTNTTTMLKDAVSIQVSPKDPDTLEDTRVPGLSLV